MVAVPIGNPLDLTQRARDILLSADVIACEDTRVSGELMSSLGGKTPRLLSHHEHNESASATGLIELINQGQRIALISDAGTPLLSDPGHHLVRQAFAHGITPRCIPGASSLAATLSVCPIGGSTHFFGGFPPSQRGNRKRVFERVQGCADRLVFFESPHRLVEHLEDAQTVFGDTDVFVARELTKPHEELLFKSLNEMLLHFQQTQPRGEFVIVYKSPEPEPLSADHVERHIRKLVEQGKRDQEIVDELRETSGLKRKEIYDLIQRIKGKLE